MPVHEIVQPKLAKMHTLGWWTPQGPTPQLILGNINRRHRPNGDIVHGDRDRSCDFVATENPRHGDRQQRLEWIERREAKKNSDRRPERDGMRRIRDRQQRHVMRHQPALQPRQWSW